jgi:DNA-binding GntR family transcriptional regulator
MATRPSAGSEAPVRRYATAGEFIVESLRTAILTGQLAAGAPLPLDSLAEQFGTSVIPVREALRRLEAERLVILRPHRTAQVAALSTEELNDLYRVRLVLDVQAARWAHGRLGADELHRMGELVDAMESHALAGDDLQAFAAHTEFHHLIYAAAGSPTLLEILEGLWDETERYRHAVKHYRSDAATWAAEHRLLIALYTTGTAAQTAREMRAHLTRTVEALLRARGVETHMS